MPSATRYITPGVISTIDSGSQAAMTMQSTMLRREGSSNSLDCQYAGLIEPTS